MQSISCIAGKIKVIKTWMEPLKAQPLLYVTRLNEIVLF